MDFKNWTKGVKNSVKAILTKNVKVSKFNFGPVFLYSCILSLFLCLVLVTGFILGNLEKGNVSNDGAYVYGAENPVVYIDKNRIPDDTSDDIYYYLTGDSTRSVVKRFDLSTGLEITSPVDFEVILYSDKTIVYRGTGTITDTLTNTSMGINFKLDDEDDATRIVTSDAGFKPSSCKNLFAYYYNIEQFDLSNLDSSDVEDFEGMFAPSGSLYATSSVSLDLSNLDTRKAKNAKKMFSASRFRSITFGPNCTFELCEDMTEMFLNSNNLETLDLSMFNTKKVKNSSRMFDGCNALTDITFGPNCTFEECENFDYMFNYCNNLGSNTTNAFDLSMFNTKKVLSAKYMFKGCTSLTKIKFGTDSTFEKCTDMIQIFYLCHELKELNIQMFDTSNVNDFSSFVEECWKLEEINVGEKFTTKNANDLDWMFTQCFELKDNVNNIIDSTENATNVSKMFYCTYNSDTIDLRKYDLSHVSNGNINQFFYSNDSSAKNNYKSIYGEDPKEIPYRTIYLPSKVNEYSRNIDLLGDHVYRLVDNNGNILLDNIDSFDPCYDASGLPKYSNAKLVAIDNLLLYKGDTDNNGTDEEYYLLGSADTDGAHVVKRWDLSNAEETTSPCSFEVILYDDGMLLYRGSGQIYVYSHYADYPWKTIDTGIIPNKIATATEGFKPDSCYNLFALTKASYYDLSTLDTTGVTNFENMFIYAGDDTATNLVLDLTNLDSSLATICSKMFQDSNFTEIKFGPKCTFSNTDSYSQMFYGCTRLKKANTGMFNSPVLKYTLYMFSNCNSLEEIDLTNLNTKNVTNAGNMFNSIGSDNKVTLNTSIKSITFGPNCTFESCSNISNMFRGLTKLTSLDLTYFDTRNANNSSNMFYDCVSLTEIKFGTNCTFANCTNFGYVFNHLRLIETLDLKYFDTRNADSITAMFQGCWNLKNIIIGENFTTKNATNLSWMFCECFSLENDVAKIIDDTSKATNVKGMLDSTFNSSIVDLRKFDLSNVASGNSNYSSFFNNDGSITSGGIKNYINKFEVNPPDISAKVIYLPSKVNDNSKLIDLLGTNAYKLVDKYGRVLVDNVDNFSPCYKADGTLIDNAYALVSDGGLELMDHILYEEDTDSDGTIDKEYWLLGTDFLKVKARWNLFKPEGSSGELITKPGKCEVILYEDGMLIYRGYDPSYNQQSVYVVPDWAKEYDGVVPTRIRMAYEGFKVNDMYYFFDKFETITDIDLTNIDISDCNGSNTNFQAVFYNCSNLEKVNLSSLDFTGLTNAKYRYMFTGTKKLESVDISNFLPGRPVDRMFENSGIKNIILPDGFINSSTTDIEKIFSNCNRLESLDFSTCDFTGITNANSALSGCNALKEIYIPEKKFGIDITLPLSNTNGNWVCLNSSGGIVYRTPYKTLQYKKNSETSDHIPGGIKLVPGYCINESCFSEASLYYNGLVHTFDPVVKTDDKVLTKDVNYTISVNSNDQLHAQNDNGINGPGYSINAKTDGDVPVYGWAYCYIPINPYDINFKLSEHLDDIKVSKYYDGTNTCDDIYVLVDGVTFTPSGATDSITEKVKIKLTPTFDNSNVSDSNGNSNSYIKTVTYTNIQIVSIEGDGHVGVITDYKLVLPEDTDSDGVIEIANAGKISNKSLGSITFDNDSYTYDGLSHTPSISVYESDGVTLVDSTKYDITYSSNERINAGNYTVTITPKDNSGYCGSLNKTYVINKKEIDLESVKEQIRFDNTKDELTIKYNDKTFNNTFSNVNTLKPYYVDNTITNHTSDKIYFVLSSSKLVNSDGTINLLEPTKNNNDGNEKYMLLDVLKVSEDDTYSNNFKLKVTPTNNLLINNGYLVDNEVPQITNVVIKVDGDTNKKTITNESNVEIVITISEKVNNNGDIKLTLESGITYNTELIGTYDGNNTITFNKMINDILASNDKISLVLNHNMSDDAGNMLNTDYLSSDTLVSILDTYKVSIDINSMIETELDDITEEDPLVFKIKFSTGAKIKDAPDSVFGAIKLMAGDSVIPKEDYAIGYNDTDPDNAFYTVTLPKNKVLSLSSSGTKTLKIEIPEDALEDINGVKAIGAVKEITVKNTVKDPTPPIDPKPSITTQTITIQTITHESYIDGYNDKTFKPNQNMTRAEFSKIIASISNNYSDLVSNKEYNKKYPDITDDKWYSNYVGYVTKLNLMQGDEKGFRPNDNITRAEVSRVLKNLFKINKMTNKEKDAINTYGDELNNRWFKEDMVSLITNGYMKGYPDGTVKPKNNITRAEIVSLINRLKERNVSDNYKETINKLSNIFTDINKNNWYYYDVIEASVNH